MSSVLETMIHYAGMMLARINDSTKNDLNKIDSYPSPKLKEITERIEKIFSCSHFDFFSQNSSSASRDLSFKGIKEISNNEAIALVQEHISALHLGWNAITDRGVITLVKNPSLTALRLNNNEIGDNGAVELAKISTLTSLDLSFNHIGDDGVIALSALKALTILNLDHNFVADKGVSVLAKNQSLTFLNLTINRVTDEGAIALAQSLTLTSLNLSDNHDVSDKGLIALAHDNTLVALSLGECNFTFRGIGIMELAESPSLIFLHLACRLGTLIEEKHVIPFLSNTNLISLCIDNIDLELIDRKLPAQMNARIEKNIKHLQTWQIVALFMAFQRANRDHPFRDSILDLLSKGGDLGEAIRSYL